MVRSGEQVLLLAESHRRALYCRTPWFRSRFLEAASLFLNDALRPSRTEPFFSVEWRVTLGSPPLCPPTARIFSRTYCPVNRSSFSRAPRNTDFATSEPLQLLSPQCSCWQDDKCPRTTFRCQSVVSRCQNRCQSGTLIGHLPATLQPLRLRPQC